MPIISMHKRVENIRLINNPKPGHQLLLIKLYKAKSHPDAQEPRINPKAR